MGRLHDLHDQQGQSPWLDNLKRAWVDNGELERWVERGVRGITSNPTIFQKAIESTNDYDDQFGTLVRGGASIDDAYWELVTTDIRSALAILRPIHDASDGVDGFVSVEVAPALAHDTAGTTAAARHLATTINEPNLYVKIPGTAAGLLAITTMISEGHSVNVTLLFSVQRYAEVIEAYMTGLEAHPGDLSGVSSVASFFISRVDTEVDRRLDEIGTDAALALRGRAAVANAQVAYRVFTEAFTGPRWQALADRGARVQRPLWASTSTKNPDYPDTLYVDTLIGPNTVNTMPDATLDDFDDHGSLGRSVDADAAGAVSVLQAIADVGVDIDAVTRVLEAEGVASFTKSFDELLAVLASRAAEFRN